MNFSRHLLTATENFWATNSQAVLLLHYLCTSYIRNLCFKGRHSVLGSRSSDCCIRISCVFQGLSGSQPFHSAGLSGNFGASTLYLSEKGPSPSETTGRRKSDRKDNSFPTCRSWKKIKHRWLQKFKERIMKSFRSPLRLPGRIRPDRAHSFTKSGRD